MKLLGILAASASLLYGEAPTLHPELRLAIFNLFSSGIFSAGYSGIQLTMGLSIGLWL